VSRIPDPPKPKDYCPKCKKPKGDFRGYYGPQCMGHEPKPDLPPPIPGDRWGPPPR
jgi:hypothetical protein